MWLFRSEAAEEQQVFLDPGSLSFFCILYPDYIVHPCLSLPSYRSRSVLWCVSVEHNYTWHSSHPTTPNNTPHLSVMLSVVRHKTDFKWEIAFQPGVELLFNPMFQWFHITRHCRHYFNAQDYLTKYVTNTYFIYKHRHCETQMGMCFPFSAAVSSSRKYDMFGLLRGEPKQLARCDNKKEHLRVITIQHFYCEYIIFAQ